MFKLKLYILFFFHKAVPSLHSTNVPYRAIEA